ncbi:MAG TPA: FlgD immunoglobulin-like domain containing protein [Candidatus Eisenbacteria bacterium]|nr:FlgD immunoglobulin-like domain containing protein [Candidatus Eisenbacteria bacterium]
MTPRATWSPHVGRKRTLLVAGLTALFALLFATSPAAADLTSIATEPPNPTICDSVAVVVSGATPTPCYEIVFTELNGPVELPTMGPIPTYEIRVRIVLRHVTPPGGACPAVIQPYQKAFTLPRPLRFGTYWVRAVEYLVQDGSETPQDTLSSSFNVTFSDACPTDACILLGFGTPVGDRWCHASAPPGGRASLPITLMNPVPVGGMQTDVVSVFHRDPLAGSVRADSHLVVVPVDVVTTDRTSGFQVAWTAEGSRVRVILYPTTSGAEIAPGQGSIFRVIYQVSSHAVEQVQLVMLEETIVADPLGNTIFHCPTIRPPELTVDYGRICIGTPGCDLNEDGTSNILDIVQLVNCALAGGGSEACPDEVAARADCNGDGGVDIRDVICCIRKILGSGGFGTTDPGEGTGDPTRIGFTGPVQWITPLTGRAEVEVEPGSGFAGIDFAIDAASSGARIAGLRLLPGSGLQLESSVAPDGSSARAMLLQMGGGSSTGGEAGDAMRSDAGLVTATILVDLVPLFPVGDGGALNLVGAQSANRHAVTMPTMISSGSAPVPDLATPVTPSVTAARPNPFRDETEIAYALPAATHATLRVYSASGRLVRTLVDSAMPAGVHRAHWDGKDSTGRPVSSGIYFFRFTAAEVTRTQRLMLLR